MGSLNGDMLSMILKMIGVRNLSAQTDRPDAVIQIQFERYGQVYNVSYKLDELIQAVQASAPDEPPPPDFTDLASIHIPDPSSG